MEGLTTDNIIAIVSLALVYLGVGIAAYQSLKVQVAEHTKDIAASKKDMEEHKLNNKECFDELKQLMKDDRAENRRDHESIMKSLSEVNQNFSDLKTSLITAFQPAKRIKSKL